MLAVARDMEEVCPDAWLIQAGNPVFQGCTLLTRETGIKVCGLCHGHYGYRKMATKLGIDSDKITWQAPGLNHNIWLSHFYYDGQDAYPLVDKWIEEHGKEYWNSDEAEVPVPPDRQGRTTSALQRAWEIDLSRGAVHMYRMYGLLPVGDTPRRGGWWYHADFQAKLYWYGKPWGGQDTPKSWPLYVENLERRIQRIWQVANDPGVKLTDELGTTKTTEQHVPIIDGLVNDNEGQFQVNIPNKGALAGLPDDVVVEVPALVNKIGIQPLRVEPLPPKLMLEQIYPDWLTMERQLLALETGDKSILLYNVLDWHTTQSYNQAMDFVDALLTKPGNEGMKEYFAYPEGFDQVGHRIPTNKASLAAD
jgi:alpha-galactosidase